MLNVLHLLHIIFSNKKIEIGIIIMLILEVWKPRLKKLNNFLSSLSE